MVLGGRPSQTASIAVTAAPNTPCTIGYTTPLGTRSTAAGLVTKTTDGRGRASWSFVIGTGTRPGTGEIAVTCGGVTATSAIVIA
ncbi:MAG: hypothetical protein JO247_09330 [Chloroflexi bacterium]|nr:hypothetical protein [Chloroflexota bacterium]